MPNESTPKPNIVVFLTDDLDVLSTDLPLNKTKSWINSRGVNFENAFVSTPVCCPSRARYSSERMFLYFFVKLCAVFFQFPDWPLPAQHGGEEQLTPGRVLRRRVEKR